MKLLRNIGIFITIAIGFLACKNEVSSYVTITGETMGTTYSIICNGGDPVNLKNELDALLQEVNADVSTYIKTSLISRFNQAEKEISFKKSEHPHFLANYFLAKEVNELTTGAFEPTVMPLVNYWGFGYTGKDKVTQVDSMKIDSLLEFVGFSKVSLEDRGDSVVLRKSLAGVQLDFSACAKGYGIDAVAGLLEMKNIQDYMVEIGREVRVKGKSSRGDAWNIGISYPKEAVGQDDIFTAIPFSDRSLATSGNYQNFYEVDGKKYSHTINPVTGFPERNSLLSSSVFAENCMKADAYATAFMVLGTDKAFELVNKIEGLDAYFIYNDGQDKMEVKYTDGLKENIEALKK